MRKPPKRTRAQRSRAAGRRGPSKRAGPRAPTVAQLRARLAEAEETLAALRSGDVDAIVVQGDKGEQVFTLKGADHRYRRLVETMTEGAATLALEGTVLYANKELAAFLGRPLQKVLGASFHDFVAPASRTTVEAILRVTRSGPRKGEVTLLDAAGNELPAFLSANVNDDDDEAGASIVVTDLRLQWRNEQIVASERLARSILDQVGEAIVVCDPEGVVIRASQAAHQLAGPKLLLEPFGALPVRLHGETCDSLGQLHEHVLRGEKLAGLDASFEKPGAEPVDVQLSARPLRDKRGQALGTVVSIVDITEHKRAQSGLRQSVRIRDEFLSVAGHELKTPLTAMQLQLQSIRRVAVGGGALTPERLVERLDKLVRHVERLARLINELLDVSRITAGRLSLEREEVELTSLLDEICDRFADELGRAGCDLRLHASEAVVGQWDRMRLDQVFTNVIGNAFKYGANKPIVVTVARRGDLAEVSVADQGIGISEADRARLFGRFERAVSERHYGGFGLGLWISRQIVEALGGSIRFESTPGVGTTFFIVLPLKAAATS